jgi:hypothetical protein
MGAELYIQFEKGEKAKCKSLLNEKLGTEANKEWDFPLSVGGHPCGVFVKSCGGSKIEIGYSFGGDGGEVAIAMAAFLGQRFAVKKYGWDSTGYLNSAELEKFPITSLTPMKLRIDAHRKWHTAFLESGNAEAAEHELKAVSFYQNVAQEITSKIEKALQ